MQPVGKRPRTRTLILIWFWVFLLFFWFIVFLSCLPKNLWHSSIFDAIKLDQQYWNLYSKKAVPQGNSWLVKLFSNRFPFGLISFDLRTFYLNFRKYFKHLWNLEYYAYSACKESKWILDLKLNLGYIQLYFSINLASNANYGKVIKLMDAGRFAYSIGDVAGKQKSKYKY